MKTKWLIQSSGINFQHYNSVCQTLLNLNYKINDFGIIDKTLTNLENILDDSDNYVFRGSTRLLTLFNNIENITELNPYLSKEQITKSNLKKLKKGINYDVDLFDQKKYGNLNLPLLNDKAYYFEIKDNLKRTFQQDMFIKPSRDLKAFNGGILEKGITIEEFIKANHYQSFYLEETAILANIEEIFEEYRFFIIDGEVITGSMYKKDNKLFLDNFIPEEILKTAKEYAKLYKPSDIFVMDLAKTKKWIKIVEYNCWNSSGVYNCNLNKLFSEINNFKNL